MLLSNDKSASERFPSEPPSPRVDPGLARHRRHTVCVQLRVNVDIMQPLEFQYLCFPFSDSCLSALAAQPLPGTAAVTITSATIMKIEQEKMLAWRRTASLADAAIRLHNVAPPNPRWRVHRKGGCSKCRWSCLIHPFKNIDLFFLFGGGGAGWRAQTEH